MSPPAVSLGKMSSAQMGFVCPALEHLG